MDRNFGELARAFAAFMKPGPGKLAIFALLAVMLLFLPLYPVHADRYIGPDEYTILEPESSGTSMKSLYIVLDEGYNWTEMDITVRELGFFVRFEDYHMTYYDANPAYLGMFLGLGLLAYCAGCYYVESTRQEKKAGQ